MKIHLLARGRQLGFNRRCQTERKMEFVVFFIWTDWIPDAHKHGIQFLKKNLLIIKVENPDSLYNI